MIKKYLEKIGIINSIRGKLVLYFVLLLILPLSALTYIAYEDEKTVIRARVVNQLSSIADSRKPIIENWLTERVNDTIVLADNALVRAQFTELTRRFGADVEGIRMDQSYIELLDNLTVLRDSYGYAEISLFDTQGRILVSTSEAKVGTSSKDARYFTEGLKAKPKNAYINDIFEFEDIGGPAMAFSLPINSYAPGRPGGRGLHGDIVGVAALIYGMDKTFYPLILGWPGQGKTGETLLVRREGDEVVYLNRLKYVSEAPLKFRFPVARGWPLPALNSSGGLEGSLETVDYRGEPIIAAYRYIPMTKWGFVVKLDSSEAFAPVRYFGISALLLLIASAVFIGLLILVISRRITTPISRLDETTRSLARGDFSVDLPTDRNDEIGRLTSSFIQMAKDLERYNRELINKGEELEKTNRDLLLMTESLEGKVNERTRELEESRNKLRENLDIVERANVEFRRLDRMKDHFLGMMSHELRTPLSLIMGYSSNILSEPSLRLDPHVEEAFEGIQKGAERLKNIITEMLDVSRIDARGLKLDMVPTDLGKLVRGVVKELDSFVRERGQKLAVGDFSSVPRLQLDRRRMYQVLVNIIGNAIKFTPDGGRIDVIPHIHPAGTGFIDGRVSDDSDYVGIEVKDSGIGIDKEELDRVFEKFYEVGDIEKHATSKYDFLGRGVGLGLPIARGIVEAHNGKLWAESPGYDPVGYTGSSFHILLPIGVRPAREPKAQAPKAREAVPAAAGPRGAKLPAVLIIDDEPDILNLTSIILGRSYTVIVADDGAEGLKLARERLPDLVLIDIYMEGIDGYEICRTLKGDKATRHIPVAMFSAGVQRWEVEMGYKAGADDYITKPFKPDELLEKVGNIIKGGVEPARK